MNVTELSRRIRARLTEIVSNLQLESEDPNDAIKPPRIVNGYLPPKGVNTGGDFPYVIVRPSTGRTGDDGMSTVEVKLLIGCYSEDYDGFEYALLVLDTIQHALLASPTLPDSPFRMELPIDWDMNDDQPWPEWVLEATTRWTVATPQTTEPVDNLYSDGV